MTGLSAARRLGEVRSQDRILLVDARPVGWGASGRNSGFLIDLPHKFDLERPERDRLHRIIGLNRAAIASLEAAVRQHDIRCDWSPVGKLQGAVRERGTGMMRKFIEALEFVGEPHEVLDRDGCAAIMGTDYYAGAVFTPGCVLVDPFSLVRGLAANLPANVDLCDDTAVVGFAPERGSFRATLRSSMGEERPITANKVILATDPYVPEFGYMKDRILPTITFASITRPLTRTELKGYAGRSNWGLTPADAAGTTLRMTSDNRLLIRNHYAYAPHYRAADRDLIKARNSHRTGIDRRFPPVQRGTVHRDLGRGRQPLAQSRDLFRRGGGQCLFGQLLQRRRHDARREFGKTAGGPGCRHPIARTGGHPCSQRHALEDPTRSPPQHGRQRPLQVARMGKQGTNSDLAR